MFALLVDESRDCSGHEQLSIVLQVVALTNNNKYVIQEYFLGLVRLHEFGAQTLSNETVKFLLKYGIKLELCIS
ncbi:unnamed protein product [Rotaria sp. Silwood1]|nr:unnamed protein product [Rotaria sp. Silwood1]